MIVREELHEWRDRTDSEYVCRREEGRRKGEGGKLQQTERDNTRVHVCLL